MVEPPLFLFGTLRHAPLLALIAGEDDLHARPALVRDMAVVHACSDGGGRAGPMLTPRQGAQAQGLLITPGAKARARIEACLAAHDLSPAPIIVDSDAGAVQACHYLSSGAAPGRDWSLEAWVAAHGDFALALAQEMMAHWPLMVAARYLPMLERRVASRLRAARQPAPCSQRRRAAEGDVQARQVRRPHQGFFALDLADLRHRRFDGTLSPELHREGFVMADAVTVLPYDACADLVLLVEQFRLGPWLRGDPQPWMLEPIAGYIDAGESPEDAARREAREEAGLDLGALHRIGGYYPSPGAVSEFTHSFIALASLDGKDGTIGGLEGEAEDIRAHVIAFDRLLALAPSGELATGPLLLSVLWLEKHRERLRAEGLG